MQAKASGYADFCGSLAHVSDKGDRNKKLLSFSRFQQVDNGKIFRTAEIGFRIPASLVDKVDNGFFVRIQISPQGFEFTAGIKRLQMAQDNVNRCNRLCRKQTAVFGNNGQRSDIAERVAQNDAFQKVEHTFLRNSRISCYKFIEIGRLVIFCSA